MACEFVDYTRLSIHLPTNTRRRNSAARQIIDAFKTKYKGSTFSSLSNSPFTGTWKPAAGPSVTDPICVLTIDLEFSFHSEREKVERIAAKLLRFAQDVYLTDEPQDAFWITCLPISVLAA